MPDSLFFPEGFSVQENQDISQPSPSSPAVGHARAWWPHGCSPGSLSPTPASQWPAGREREKLEHRHTWLSNVQDLAEDQGELDAASSEGTFVFVFPAAVLEDKLEERASVSCYMGHGHERCANGGAQTCHTPPEPPTRAVPPG